MALVLGIDAAWTERGSSALALLHVNRVGRKVIAVAPSYAGFIGLARGELAQWSWPPGGLLFDSSSPPSSSRRITFFTFSRW